MVALKVQGMHCQGCEMLIRDILDETDGIEDTKVSHMEGTVRVDFDESILSLDKIKNMITEAGYEVE